MGIQGFLFLVIVLAFTALLAVKGWRYQSRLPDKRWNPDEDD